MSSSRLRAGFPRPSSLCARASSALVLAACADGLEPPPTGSASGAGVGGNTSSAAESSVASSGGMGGAGAAGGDGGGGPSTATSGSTSDGSSSATTGAGGAGGMGGAGGAPSSGTLVVAALRGTSEALGAHYDGNGGWSAPSSLSVGFAEASFAPTNTGALLVGRVDSTTPSLDNELYSIATTGSSFGAAAPIGTFGFASDGPSAAAHGVAELVTFLGTDSKHYYAQRDGGVFGAFSPVPGGSIGSQSFGPSASSLVSLGVSVFAAYVGDDGNVYGADKPSPGGLFGLVTQVPAGASANKTVAPTGLESQNGELVLYFVRNADGRIARIARNPNTLSWGAATTVHPDAITDRTPSVALLSNGDELVVWHGSNNEGIYGARGAASFGAPFEIVAPGATASAPVAIAAVDASADAEIVVAVGGALVHARLSSTTVTTTTVAGIAGALGVSAMGLP